MEKFRWIPDQSSIGITETFDTLVSSMSIGPEERKSISGPKKEWSLIFRKDRVDAREIWEFYVDRRGSFEAFLFVCPIEKSECTVRFADDNLSRIVLWRKVYEFGLRLIEVYQE